MSATRLRRWVLWLLPLIAARALIPAGFMLSAEHGSLQVVLCSGSGPVMSMPASSAHAHHHGQPETAAHDGSVCPFALAAMASLPGLLSALVQLLAPVTSEPEFRANAFQPSDRAGVYRIRGPPSLQIALS
jgi:hypothetical protein